MKKINYFVPLALAMTMISCNGTKKPDAETTVTEPENNETETQTVKYDWEPEDMPLIVYYGGNPYHVIDSEEEYDLLATKIANFNTVLGEDNTTKVKYKEYHKGVGGFGNLLGNHEYETYFEFESSLKKDYGEAVAVSDNSLKTHEVIKIKTFDIWGEDIVKAPTALVEQMRAKYENQPIMSSLKVAESQDKQINVYSIQFQPKGNVCVALTVVTDGDKQYILDDTTNDYNDMSAWNVDDEGIYLPKKPIAATRSSAGLDFFYTKSAPESSNFGVLMQRGDSLYDSLITQYYNYIDFRPPYEPVALPKTAKLDSEMDGYKVWINEDKPMSDECEGGVYSVYFSTPESDDVYHLVTSNQEQCDYSEYPENKFKWIHTGNIQGASEAMIVKFYDDYYGVVLTGVPDSRNSFSYLIALDPSNVQEMCRWLPANSGFHGVDVDGNLLLEKYAYGEEGRYHQICHYDLDGNLVSEDEPYYP